MLTMDKRYEGFHEIEEDEVCKEDLNEYEHKVMSLCSYLSEHPKLVSLFYSWQPGSAGVLFEE